MNINEVQQQNKEIMTNKTQSVKKYSDEKQNSSGFSYYVENSNQQEVSDANLTNEQQEDATNPQGEILPDEAQNSQATAYFQTVQALNNDIFDLMMNDKISNRFNFEDLSKYNINLTDLTLNDIKLFEGLTQNKSDLFVNSFNQQTQTFNMAINGENLDISYKSIEVSKTLFTALENAAKTGKSVRLDFGNDTSVILRISKDGKLSADFVPNEKAMETVLRNALPLLKAKLDEQNLPYGELNYKQYKQQNDNQKENKKENKKDE